MSQYKITKVINPNGEDVTSAFMTMISNKSNAMLITHDEVMENSSQLKVSAGKLLFTIEYLVSDGIYPNRSLQVQFTLKNEKPVIKKSRPVGKTVRLKACCAEGIYHHVANAAVIFYAPYHGGSPFVFEKV